MPYKDLQKKKEYLREYHQKHKEEIKKSDRYKQNNKKIRKDGICADCGIKIARKSCKRCRKCAGIIRRNNPNIDAKEYRRNWHLKKKYAMEPMDFEVYWQACMGKCFICKIDMRMPTHTRGQKLDVVVVDHDHRTMKVRGLLCYSCNKGLGYFKDDPEIIKKALNYLLM